MKSEWLWNKLASNWDKPGVSLGENDIKILDKTKKYLDGGSTVLDYGCATGSIVLELAKQVKEVCGLDISSKMLEKAQSKAEGKNNIRLIHGTIDDKRLKEESFDVITAFSILHLTDDYQQSISRAWKLLKRGGYLVTETPCLGQNIFPNILQNIPVIILSRIGILQKLSAFSANQLKDTIAQAGFQIIEHEYLSIKPLTVIFNVARKDGSN
jgi:ubiquinone/menaquinone biosynthesis C-methylase UbiE